MVVFHEEREVRHHVLQPDPGQIAPERPHIEQHVLELPVHLGHEQRVAFVDAKRQPRNELFAAAIVVPIDGGPC